MDILAVKTGAIEKLHQPIDPMTGTMRLAVIIALAARRAFVAKVQGRRLPGRIREHPLGPCPQSPQTLGKRAFARGVISLPHTFLDLLKDLAQSFRGPVTKFEKGMEKAQDDRNLGKQCLPSALGGLPAVRVHGLRGVILIQGLSFPSKDAVRSRQVWLRGRLGNRCAHQTILPSRGGDRDTRAFPPAVFFICDQVRGHALSGLDRWADETETAHAWLQPVP